MLFNRIAGTEEPKIAVWPIMMDITRVMDNDPDDNFKLSDLISKYELTTEEQTELNEYIQAITNIIQAEVAERLRIGMEMSYAVRDARVSVDALLRYALLRTEQGTITYSKFRQQLGI